MASRTAAFQEQPLCGEDLIEKTMACQDSSRLAVPHHSPLQETSPTCSHDGLGPPRLIDGSNSFPAM